MRMGVIETSGIETSNSRLFFYFPFCICIRIFAHTTQKKMASGAHDVVIPISSHNSWLHVLKRDHLDTVRRFLGVSGATNFAALPRQLLEEQLMKAAKLEEARGLSYLINDYLGVIEYNADDTVLPRF